MKNKRALVINVSGQYLNVAMKIIVENDKKKCFITQGLVSMFFCVCVYVCVCVCVCLSVCVCVCVCDRERE